MSDLLPPIAVLVLAALVATLIRGTEGAASDSPLGRRIAVFAGALLAIFVGQECLEGILAAAIRPARRARRRSGWIALPLALGNRRSLSALLAEALEGVERAIAVFHASGRCAPARPPSAAGPSCTRTSPAVDPLAFGLARRPPPLVPA